MKSPIRFLKLYVLLGLRKLEKINDAWFDFCNPGLVEPIWRRWNWDTVKGIGQAKALKTSYVFLFMVPIIAQLFTNLPDEVTVPILSTTIKIPLTLPFSWLALFACALFASIGNVIYSVFCPLLIREYKNFQEYSDSKRSGTYLINNINELAFAWNKDLIDQIVIVHRVYNKLPIELDKVLRELQGENDLTAEVFYFVRDSVNHQHPTARRVACICYILAFLCLLIIVVQNIACVIPYYMEG